LGSFVSSVFFAPAASMHLAPIADTTLSERYPENNFGAMLSFNSGTTQNSNYNRGLLRFDLAGALPPGAQIISATLTLEVVGEPNEEFPEARFNLHRLLVPWGEGNKTNPPFGGLGVGSPATADEATWTHRFAFTTNTWSQPGATAPVDYVSTISSGVTLGGVDQSPYTIPNTAQLVADLQLWLDQPATNHGWALVCQQETVKFTARRFASREDPENAPELEIHYLASPNLKISQTNAVEIQLTFAAEADHSYTVSYRHALSSGSWFPLTNLTAAATNYAAVVIDSASSTQRFYRVSYY
jgi:hypothetical protein